MCCVRLLPLGAFWGSCCGICACHHMQYALRSKTTPSVSGFGIVNRIHSADGTHEKWRPSQARAEKVCGGLVPPTNYSTCESGKRVVQRALSRSARPPRAPHRRIERRSRARGNVSQTGRQSPKATHCGARRAPWDKKRHASEPYGSGAFNASKRPDRFSRGHR